MKKIITIVGMVLLACGIGVMAIGLGGRGETQGAKMEKPTGYNDGNYAEGERINAKGTAYLPGKPGDHPEILKMEGGQNDRFSQPLFTLQDYLDGKAPYVSVAMDPSLSNPGGKFAYNKKDKLGWQLRIPEIDQKYKAQNRSGRDYIVFRLVDTGQAFNNTSGYRIDICVRRGIEAPVTDLGLRHELEKFTFDSTLNSSLTLIFDKNAPASSVPTTTTTGS